jgi:hypothetical protein
MRPVSHSSASLGSRYRRRNIKLTKSRLG